MGGGAENKIFSEKETGFGRPIFDAKCSPFNVDARVGALSNLFVVRIVMFV